MRELVACCFGRSSIKQDWAQSNQQPLSRKVGVQMKDDTDADPLATRAQPTVSSVAADSASHNRDNASGSGRLEVRCPNCHAPTEVAVDTSLTDLTCGSCGSHFSLVDQDKATRMAPALTTLGRFELIERLGIGAFGSVWKARDKELDRTVAIKVP